MAGTVMFLKGLADIVVGLIVMVKPRVIYESTTAKALHNWTGLPLTSAATAPNFNHAIACMVTAIGVGSVVASSLGREAKIPIVIMNAAWGLSMCLTCVLKPELASATMAMTALNTTVYTLVVGILVSRDDSGVERKSKKD
ncbi:hypothetical protein NMY22_g9049 [Coprinellus aureogranulatus]|nr:hypothetical protein NMY22_g12577 [Coprinellus aureogranulatus]KAJ3529299.1 hypothetical protein NMY22_g9049 [Coprinellus aureogranulatus]